MVVNFRSYINREIFCCFFAEQASLANTRVYNYKNEIKMALHCLSTSGVSGTKKMHILRTEFALISILPRKGKRIARFREEVYSWRDVKTGLDIIEKYSFFWKIGGRRTLPFFLFFVWFGGGFRAVKAPFWGNQLRNAGSRKTAVKSRLSRSFLLSVCVCVRVYLSVCLWLCICYVSFFLLLFYFSLQCTFCLVF